MEKDLKVIPAEIWDIVPPEQKKANAKRRNKKNNGGDECRICAARMSELALEKAWFVHMAVNGDLVEKDAELRGELSQGWFPVGADCTKKIPLNFRKKVLKEGF